MNTFKIKSLTDVITNSSTEVFTVYNKEAVNNIKELVNAILALNNETSNLTFDDLFEVDYCFDIYEIEELINQLAEKLKERGNKEHAEAIKTTVATEEELWNYSKQNNIYDVVMEIIEEIDSSSTSSRVYLGNSIAKRSENSLISIEINITTNVNILTLRSGFDSHCLQDLSGDFPSLTQNTNFGRSINIVSININLISVSKVVNLYGRHHQLRIIVEIVSVDFSCKINICF